LAGEKFKNLGDLRTMYACFISHIGNV